MEAVCQPFPKIPTGVLVKLTGETAVATQEAMAGPTYERAP